MMDKLWYLVGALRDGSVYYDKKSRNYIVVWYQKDPSWLQMLLNFILEMFPETTKKKLKVEEYKKFQYRLRLRGKGYYLIFKKYLSKRPERPAEIASFIGGFFDAEGDVVPHQLSIGISQKDVNVLQWMKSVLYNVFDIKATGPYLVDKRSNTWRIVISQKRSLRRFLSHIPSYNSSKLKKLKKLALFLDS